MLRKVGDIVKIRKDLEDGKVYGIDIVIDEMIEYLGKCAKITNVVYAGDGVEYEIDVDNGSWCWTDEMFAENKFKKGDKVVVVKVNDVKDVKYIDDKKSFIGNIGIIDDYNNATSIAYNGTLYEHSLNFLNSTMQDMNVSDGVWLFAEEELALANRILFDNENGNKIIINYPAIIYIMKDGNKEFKGVSKVMDNDTWDEAKGIQIAKTKAEIKKLQSKLKGLSK